MITRTNVLNYATQIKLEATYMLEASIKLMKEKTDYDSEAKLKFIFNAYDDYNKDVFQSEVIEILWFEICMILSNTGYEKLEEYAKKKEYYKFLLEISLEETREFIEENFDKLDIILYVIAHIREDYPFKCEDVNV